MGHSKNFTRVLSIYKNDVISLGYKLSIVQKVSSRFATQIFGIKANILPFSLFAINESANMSKSNHFPCTWKVIIRFYWNSCSIYLLIIPATSLFVCIHPLLFLLFFFVPSKEATGII